MRNLRISEKVMFISLIIVALIFMTNVSYSQNQGSHRHNGRHHANDWPDSLETITVSGKIRVSITHTHAPYYLESENEEKIGEYALDFGPHWYQPKNGATRPQNSDEVIIRGGIIPEEHNPPLIVVFEISGMFWRDSTGAPPWSGAWLYKNADDTTFIYCPTDSLDWMVYPPQSMHSLMFPDSIYCQFEEMSPEFPPGVAEPDMFEGYYIDSFNYQGNHMHSPNGMMEFNQDIGIRFHYDENNLEQLGLSEESIQVKYLDNNFEWQVIAEAEIDMETNTVFIIQNPIHTFYALKASPATTIEVSKFSGIPIEFILFPNFPNPFNSITAIRYDLPKQSHILLIIYDLLGRPVRTLVNDMEEAGSKMVIWDGMNSDGTAASAGMYLYRISTDGKANNFYDTHKMLLLR